MFMTRRFVPLTPFMDLRREMDRLLDTFGGEGQGDPRFQPFPALNLWEQQDKLMVEAEVPGLKMEHLEIAIQGNELTLKGQRQPPVGDDAVYHRRERGIGEFTRFLTLPVEIEAERVEAVLKNGVLTISLPKAEQARARKITVRSA